MYFPSSKALILSLLASAPLAHAAPSKLEPGSVRSVQLEQSRSSEAHSYDYTRRRRSPEGLAALAARVQARAPPQGGKPETNPNKPVDPNRPVDPNQPIDPNNPTNPNKNPADPNDPPADNPVDPNTQNRPVTSDPSENLKLPALDSEDYKANIEAVTTKGGGLKTDLQSVLGTTTADTGRTEKVVGQPPALGYQDKIEPLDDESKLEMGYLSKYGIQISSGQNDGWQTRDIFSDDEAASKGKSTIKIAGNKAQKAAVVMYSFGQKYDSRKATTWTHMFYDSLKEIFGDSLSTIKYISRHSITSKVTQDKQETVYLQTVDAINYAFSILGDPIPDDSDNEQDPLDPRVRNIDLSKPLTIDFGSTETNAVKAIDYLSGQTHVGRVLQFLKDYHVELGNKNIAKLHLYSDENPETLNYDIVIELTD